MAQISRLRSLEISNGNLIDADDLDAELDQLVSTTNGKPEIAEANTFTAANTFSHTSGVTTDKITERTTGNGVSVDGCLVKNGYITAKGTGWGCLVDVASNTQATIAIGVYPDDTNADIIEVADPLTVDITTSGENGADGFTEANSTWYSVWIIKKPDGTVASLLSTSATSPTLPSGYTLKRRVGWVRNDGSGNFIPSYQVPAGPLQRWTIYRVTLPAVTEVVGATNILDGGTSTAGAVPPNTPNYVPSTSTLARIKFGVAYVSGAGSMRLAKNSGGSQESYLVNPNARIREGVTDIETTTSQNIYYINSSSGIEVDLAVKGYLDNL